MGLSFSSLVLLFCIYTFTLKTMQEYGKKKALEKWRALQTHICNLEGVLKIRQHFLIGF